MNRPAFFGMLSAISAVAVVYCGCSVYVMVGARGKSPAIVEVIVGPFGIILIIVASLTFVFCFPAAIYFAALELIQSVIAQEMKNRK